MQVPAVNSALCRHAALFAVLMLGAVPISFAQPGNHSPELYGDRQAGYWGDPGRGHFGNPAAGNFDNSLVREPPPGTRALGKLHGRKPAEGSPYVSLPAPLDAATPANGNKPESKRVRKKASGKKETAG